LSGPQADPSDVGMLLERKVAIVTGAGSGIGRSSAIRFAAEGASVLVADVRGDRAAKVADIVTAAGGRAAACETDVSDAAQVEAMVAIAVRSLGGLDVIFSNAGWNRPG